MVLIPSGEWFPREDSVVEVVFLLFSQRCAHFGFEFTASTWIIEEPVSVFDCGLRAAEVATLATDCRKL